MRDREDGVAPVTWQLISAEREGKEEARAKSALIVDAYTYRNAGDAAIVLATADILRRRGVGDIRVASRHIDSDRDFYEGHGLEVVPASVAFPVKGAGNDLLRGLTFVWSALASVILTLAFHLSPRLAVGASHIVGLPGFAFLAMADTVVLCGGGYLYSPDSRLNLTLLHCALTRWLARGLGKRLLMMPQSIGPFRRRSDELIAAAALRAVDRIVVREEQSATEARRLVGVSREIVVCPDIALYGWEGKACMRREAMSLDKSVGLIAMDWTWARRAGSQELGRYVSKLGEFVSHLDESGLRVRLLASSLVPSEGQDDQEIAASVLAKARVHDTSNAWIDWEANDVEGLRSALRDQAVVVSTRLHGGLLAMVEGRPAVTLAYQPKATATYQLLGLSELCLDVQSFSVKELAQKVDMILGRLKEYEEEIARAVSHARKVIEETYLISHESSAGLRCLRA